MYHLNFKYPINVHFIGIGGISMSGLAELLHTEGFKVSGSDTKQSKVTKHLESIGITISYGQRSSNITSDLNLVVFTAAVKEDNPEYQAALAAGIPLMDRAELLGQVMLKYKDPIAVAGTHGKTTTTSLLSLMLLEGGLDPTISVGGLLDNIGGNIRIGKSGHFVAEACEYTNSFLKFHPVHAIILNIEAEHLDFFRDLTDIRNSFLLFAKKLPPTGNLIINASIDNLEELTSSLPCCIKTYGICEGTFSSLPSAYDYTASNISYDEHGFGSYDFYYKDKLLVRIALSVIGLHNISNSLAAAALAHSLGVTAEKIASAAARFKGTERRFERKGEVGGVIVVDDYAHHPTEVTATLSAARNIVKNTLWCVFQPHTYSRTRRFLSDFAKALSLADKIILSDIYAAREMNHGDISSKDLQKLLQDEYSKDVYYFATFDEIENFLLQNCNSGDMLITMGAGDIVMVGESLLGT